jgi:hypothetical protein
MLLVKVQVLAFFVNDAICSTALVEDISWLFMCGFNRCYFNLLSYCELNVSLFYSLFFDQFHIIILVSVNSFL